jgi:tRNA(Arg) A34 adenosine deaminase TadA
MAAKLDERDRCYLRLAVDLSCGFVHDERRWPFAALLVVDDQIVGQGVNRVVELHDATAHAEVLALRAAGGRLGRYHFEDGVLYASSEPCPMCLTACYWACLPRVVFGATSRDVAAHGLQDLQFYAELARPAAQRSIREDGGDGDLRRDATAILHDWARRFRPRPGQEG